MDLHLRKNSSYVVDYGDNRVNENPAYTGVTYENNFSLLHLRTGSDSSATVDYGIASNTTSDGINFHLSNTSDSYHIANVKTTELGNDYVEAEEEAAATVTNYFSNTTTTSFLDIFTEERYAGTGSKFTYTDSTISASNSASSSTYYYNAGTFGVDIGNNTVTASANGKVSTFYNVSVYFSNTGNSKYTRLISLHLYRTRTTTKFINTSQKATFTTISGPIYLGREYLGNENYVNAKIGVVASGAYNCSFTQSLKYPANLTTISSRGYSTYFTSYYNISDWAQGQVSWVAVTGGVDTTASYTNNASKATAVYLTRNKGNATGDTWAIRWDMTIGQSASKYSKSESRYDYTTRTTSMLTSGSAYNTETWTGTVLSSVIMPFPTTISSQTETIKIIPNLTYLSKVGTRTASLYEQISSSILADSWNVSYSNTDNYTYTDYNAGTYLRVAEPLEINSTTSFYNASMVDTIISTSLVPNSSLSGTFNCKTYNGNDAYDTTNITGSYSIIANATTNYTSSYPDITRTICDLAGNYSTTSTSTQSRIGIKSVTFGDNITAEIPSSEGTMVGTVSTYIY